MDSIVGLRLLVPWAGEGRRSDEAADERVLRRWSGVCGRRMPGLSGELRILSLCVMGTQGNAGA
jgi:hypothetical protein